MAAFFIVRRNRHANRVFRSRIDNYVGLNVNTEALGEEVPRQPGTLQPAGGCLWRVCLGKEDRQVARDFE